MFCLALIGFIYQLAGLFDITPPVSENEIEQIVVSVLDVAALLGVIVDPTTKGLSDSDRAMSYEEPK